MPPSPSAASRHSLASYSDTLADFLDQWNSVILDVASIAATFAVLFPSPESHPKPLPAAETQHNPAPEPAEREPSPAPLPERVPEPNLPGEPQGPEPNAVPSPERERELSPSPEQEREPSPSPEQERQPSLAPEPEPKPNPKPAPEPEPEPVPRPAPNPVRARKDGDPSAAELELRCKQMNFRELRRFVTAHVRDREWLRKVGPAALRRAEDPASLVLRAVGRYYISAESGDAEAACMLLLELYVRAGCPRPPGQGHGEAAELRQEAREAALTWRSRLLRVSGRVGDAGARGARGLAFFMAAFGVPVEFPAQELYELLVAADISACTKVLKFSKHFVKKMRDVVVEMINKDMHLQAIRIILAFELQNAFPVESTLTHIMEKLDHDRKDESEGQALARDEEELTLLRSISKCMENHKLCPSEFPNFAERIALLEERVGKPKQAFAGIKRKRTIEEDCVE
ncbi:hypothetical protein SETIT_9G008800v2 [Setaria italica]|uniref:FRIGIDA-like protein n=1 Tax=Setaria italica TaxID=4555 RepID=K4A9Q5_SETIT|nr:uncharacterized protein LOC101752584 [Setaria italica]RCV39911.1 hypothetical protein SETIT_9G008800v2 [Setaria italica]